ncbi:MAG: hypothetical protein EP344_08915 [Bacteroidetes bacterium]|nr:MAG: hypothetical protein EP344_08915 [Bacteroidota bacterium]
MSHETDPLDSNPVLIEGVDYYLEKGYMVFTAHFLFKRGKCCGSGCRHCPYRTKKKGTASNKS